MHVNEQLHPTTVLLAVLLQPATVLLGDDWLGSAEPGIIWVANKIERLLAQNCVCLVGKSSPRQWQVSIALELPIYNVATAEL